MKKLTVCQCPECDTEFAMQRSDLEGVPDVSCPVCGTEFEPPDDEEAEDDDEDDEDDQ